MNQQSIDPPPWVAIALGIAVLVALAIFAEHDGLTGHPPNSMFSPQTEAGWEQLRRQENRFR